MSGYFLAAFVYLSMNSLKKYIREVKDYPRKGVVFKDLTPLLNTPKAVQSCLEKIVDSIGSTNINKVVAMEARGFFFGTLIAQRLVAGFVPVRKLGKLPGATISREYELEYGTDFLEIHRDAISPGDKVLIHDDVLATGGTAAAVCAMVEELGGEIVQCNFILELDFLTGRKKIEKYPVYSVLHY